MTPLSNRSTLQRDILESLRDGSMTIAEIALVASAPERGTREAVNALCNSGHVIRAGSKLIKNGHRPYLFAAATPAVTP